jgi:hypothetical protein
LALGWDILWEHHSGAFGRDNQTRPSYEDECRHLGEWLLLNDIQDGASLTTFADLDRNRLTVVNIDLDDDVRLGRILGYAGILISAIRQYVDDHGIDGFYNQQPSTGQTTLLSDRQRPFTSSPPIILISLHGRFQYQDDPSPQVLHWLQTKGQHWRKWRKPRPDASSPCIRVAAHIRVPEDYCSQEWKDANGLSHVLGALSALSEQWERFLQEHHHYNDDDDDDNRRCKLSLDVFTEDRFSTDGEATLLTAISSMDAFDDGSVRIHRQTPLLDTVQSMATCDVFIPASSYLSAFAAFFHCGSSKCDSGNNDYHPSFILLPEESTRREKYFAPHLGYSVNATATTTTTVQDDGSCLPNNPTCPIVSSQNHEEIYQIMKCLAGNRRYR